MAGAGLLEKLTFKAEPESEPEPETSLYSESESEPDSEYILPPDPAPLRREKGRRKAPSADAPKVTSAMKREARDTLEAMVELPIALWQHRDPTCASVAAEQQTEIVDSLLAIIVKRPAWLAVLTDLGTSGDWLRMLKALYPVLMIVLAHHVSKTAGDPAEEDDLSQFRAPRLAG